jgi:hypothetical protein
MQNCHLAALALRMSFLIQLSRIDAKLSSGCLGSSCGRSLFISYQELMQNVPLDTLALVVVVSYPILIQI